ncbi:MAG: FAD-binding oxidoreductase [Acidimicrobiales bacterium]
MLDPSAMSRREFLRQAGAAATVLGSTAGLGAVAAACGTSRSRQAVPTTTTKKRSPNASGNTTHAGPPPWSDLARSLTGRLILPPDAAFGADKELYNERFDTIDPAAIAYCRTSSDVQRCVRFARSNGVTVAARSGGHSYGGYSSTSGLVVDVTSMSTVTVRPGGSAAVIGAGARLIDVYNTLGQQGLLLPGGSCPTVGIAGLALGGGVGVVGRRFGLTCDHLESVELVTADDRLVTADAGTNQDLYWACRGGGGGNFGIVTSFTFKVDPIPPLALFTLEWPWSAASTVLGEWLAWLPTTPRELWSNCQLLSAGAAGGSTPLSLRVTGVYCGQTATLTSLLQPFVSSVGSAPTFRFVGSEPYLKAMLIEAGCEGSTVAECHLPTQNPAGTLSRSAFAAKSTYLTGPPGGTAVTVMVHAVETLANDVPQVGGGMVFDAYGGAINAVPAGSTAFVHRDALAGIQYSVSWSAGAAPTTVAEATSWLATTETGLGPFASGAYVNYIDPTLGDWEAAYYGANLARLQRVKTAVDPDDFFHFAQSIPVLHSGSSRS